MFTGFPTENMPAIQVWDFYNSPASSGTGLIASIFNDCAPIQFFRTGGATFNIDVYLPADVLDGKIIYIVNQPYGNNKQYLYVRSSDSGANGSSDILFTVSQGEFLILTYSKYCLSFGTTNGRRRTGWLTLNKNSQNSFAYDSIAFGGNSNNNLGRTSSVFGGDTNSITSAAIGSSIVGGSLNTLSSTYSTILGGAINTASADYTAIIAAYQSTANSQYSIVLGGYQGTSRSIIGNVISPASVRPVSTTVGSSQTALLILGTQTTDATVTTLRSDTNAASTTNQVILPNNSAYFVRGSVIANVTGGGNTSSWTFQGAIKRGATAASTALVAAITPTMVAQDAGAAAWAVAVAADTTNGGLQVTVTGAAATTIRWVCRIETTEVTY